MGNFSDLGNDELRERYADLLEQVNNFEMGAGESGDSDMMEYEPIGTESASGISYDEIRTSYEEALQEMKDRGLLDLPPESTEPTKPMGGMGKMR